MQKLNPHERTGLFKLVSLLVLLFLVYLASDLAIYAPFTGISPAALPWIIFSASGVFFQAVILWGIFRGSYPALVIFVIFTVQQVGSVVGHVQFHGSLDSMFALKLIQVLLRVTVILLIFRHEDVVDFWQARQRVRTRKWLIWEIAVLVVMILGYALLWFLLARGLV